MQYTRAEGRREAKRRGNSRREAGEQREGQRDMGKPGEGRREARRRVDSHRGAGKRRKGQRNMRKPAEGQREVDKPAEAKMDLRIGVDQTDVEKSGNDPTVVGSKTAQPVLAREYCPSVVPSY